MGWPDCTVCKRRYNDAKGGCTNTACTAYNPFGERNSAPLAVVPARRPSVDLTPSSGAGVLAQTAPPTLTRALTPPTPRPPSLPVRAPSIERVESVTPDVASATPSLSSVIRASPVAFDLTVYRGEKSEWWPEPRLRLAGGLRVFEPWPRLNPDNVEDLFNTLRKHMREHANGSPNGYAQYLRAEGRPFALASARTKGGAFLGWSYEIVIKNARTFYWGEDFTLGRPANFTTAKYSMTEVPKKNGGIEMVLIDSIDADYIVLNADTLSASTILGFGHKTRTYEVTFLHDVPLSFLKSVDGRPPEQLGILTPEQVRKLPDTDKNVTAKKLLR